MKGFNMRGEMKYFKKLNLYKAPNVLFNPETMQGHSYQWWRFVDRINGKIVFNNYSYSATTCKHQGKMRDLLHRLDIKIDIVTECPKGLQDLDSGIDYYSKKIDLLYTETRKPRTHKAKNNKRLKMIRYYDDKIQELMKLKEEKEHANN